MVWGMVVRSCSRTSEMTSGEALRREMPAAGYWSATQKNRWFCECSSPDWDSKLKKSSERGRIDLAEGVPGGKGQFKGSVSGCAAAG